ncbi:ion transporter [Taibaiella lutea]|uniref:Ion transporter n=1 Tax=Taibaiella lutea TaxID=2608001 RepID=A0A5M6CNA9_9BACT|nr:ion transporter [Taibaiella lutea]KAA5534775.1 ion transporter [Taibaiella lutea]
MSLFRLIPDKHDVLQDQNIPEEKYALRRKIYIIIFQSSTPAGKAFDVGLFILIIANIILLILESVASLAARYHELFRFLNTFFMIVFTVEYLLRLYCVKKPKVYAKSFYGIVDLLSVIPPYAEFFLPNWHMLMIIRSFRLLRVFRIFRMVRFLDESRYMVLSLVRSFNKILVFLFFIVLLTVFLGTLMYVLEYEHNPGFHSIPQSIYWAIVTITTVGYGDIAPITAVGKIVASFIMILGYAIIAVPTGIMSASLVSKYREMDNDDKTCPNCKNKNHASDALFCKKCGTKLA